MKWDRDFEGREGDRKFGEKEERANVGCVTDEFVGDQKFVGVTAICFGVTSSWFCVTADVSL